jgi:hypothetical protein
MIPWAHSSRLKRPGNRNSSDSGRRDGPPSRAFGGLYRPGTPPVMRDKYSASGEMPSPSVDARAVEERKLTDQQPNSQYGGILYETTADGDVTAVHGPFDDHDGRSPGAEMKSSEGETRSPPTKDLQGQKRSHSRNLSEHFQDATTLSSDPTTYFGGSPLVASGQKHRRGYSGDVAGPSYAHRRINSIGNSTSVQRSRPHRRIDSSGLDALTAAADFSREELAAAVGNRTPWEPPHASRRSPVIAGSYEHGNLGPTVPGPPMQQLVAQHRHYPSGQQPPTGFFGPQSYHQHPYPPPSTYPPPSFYPHPIHGYGRQHAPLQTPRGYPVQYSRGQDPYNKQKMPIQQPTLESMRRALTNVTTNDHVAEISSTINDTMSPPPASDRWQGGNTQGVKTYVAAAGLSHNGRPVEANPNQVASSAIDGLNNTSAVNVQGHHRKLSSFSMLFNGLAGSGHQEHPPLKTSGAHHRSTSSTVSFLTGLDLDSTDATFLRNLQASTGAPAAVLNSSAAQAEATKLMSEVDMKSIDRASSSEDENGDSKLAPGGCSKRVRRKCTVGDCHNRVVQGGLCIAHGAKRKQCKHLGCTKHVKKAGLCSTHGPARKRCNSGSCNKVAVQGGRCIAHGAKKKLCSVEPCAKQAILGGMCKKHHDQAHQDSTGPPAGMEPMVCKIIDTKPDLAGSSKPPGKGKPGHTRGLSIFQEFSVDAVGDLLSGDAAAAAANRSQPPLVLPLLPTATHQHRSTFSRDFGSIY